MLRRCLPFLFVLSLAVVGGCATSDDLRSLRAEADMKIAKLEERIETLQGDNAALRKEIGKIGEAVEALRKSAADAGADRAELREQLQQLRGLLETLQKRTADYRELKERLDLAYSKVTFIENFLAIGKKEEPSGGNGRPKKNHVKANGTDKESLYAAAYEEFKEGRYEKAREAFQNFLKLHPRTEYSANAHYWLGECYYFEKNYEKAILEYEKVIKEYPESNKVPQALLKQGLSFLQLGDKTSGRAILEIVVRDYPNTNQARIARSKIIEIK